MLFGIYLRSRAPVEVTTYSSSISRSPAGRVDGSEPVAMIVFSALTIWLPPSLRSTAISVAELNLPQPLI
jgi:hypothetical protein